MNQIRNKRNNTTMAKANDNHNVRRSGEINFDDIPVSPILDEDTNYYGVIIECVEITKKERKMAALEIAVEGEEFPFEIVCVYQYAKEFMQFLNVLKKELGGKVLLEDFEGMQIGFSVEYNGIHPHFTDIFKVEEDTEDTDDDDDDDLNDEHEPDQSDSEQSD
jgi:hypothetical protein